MQEEARFANPTTVGLGRMGMNTARRLLGGGHQVVAYDQSPSKLQEMASEGAQGAFSLEERVETLGPYHGRSG